MIKQIIGASIIILTVPVWVPGLIAAGFGFVLMLPFILGCSIGGFKPDGK